MVQRNQTSIKYSIVATTTLLALSYSGLLSEQPEMLPLKSYKLQFESKKPWEMDYGLSSFSELEVNDSYRKYFVLQKFVHTITNQTIDLDPKIVKTLKEKFWELI